MTDKTWWAWQPDDADLPPLLFAIREDAEAAQLTYGGTVYLARVVAAESAGGE